MKAQKTWPSMRQSQVLDAGLPAWRARLVLFLLMVGSIALVGRAVYLQGMHNDFLQAQGEARYVRDVTIAATRGRILDRNGDVLATSAPVKGVWAVPADARSLAKAQMRELAAQLGMRVKDLRQKVESASGSFVYLKRQVAPAAASRIAEMKLPGIHQLPEYRRFYPGGHVMSHVLGFTGIDNSGQEGVELAFDSQLAGHEGRRRVLRDRRGRIVDDVADVSPPRNGRDVTLSIDSKLQYIANSALQQAIQDNKAKAGSVVVLDARTGEVLALANAPSYNPNNREKLSGAQLRNRALTDTYEPGSTMKPFTIGYALERGVVRPHTVIQVDYGYATFGKHRISDVSHKYAALTVAEIIERSSNVGTMKIGMRFTPNELWNLFHSVGFGTTPGLGFPGEANGRLRAAKTWRPIEQATMTYGYGLAVSLMQMAHAYTIFANDGNLLPLSLVRLERAPQPTRRVFSAKVAQEVLAMMEAATQPGASSQLARVSGYRVAGKSGTAHKLSGRQYVKKYISSFIGIAPVSDPRIIVAVMIDEPSAGAHFGGAVAAPVFAHIAEGVLRVLGVPPDAPVEPLQVAQQWMEEDESGEPPPALAETTQESSRAAPSVKSSTVRNVLPSHSLSGAAAAAGGSL